MSMHDNAPAERSKEMLLKHPPLVVGRHKDGTLDFTLSKLAGFSPEEVETLLFAAIKGKMSKAGLNAHQVQMIKAAVAGNRKEVVERYEGEAGLSQDEERGLLSWAFSVRAQEIVAELFIEQYETENARRFLNQCRDAGCHDVVEKIIHNAVRDMRKKSKGWSQDGRMRDVEALFLDAAVLQLVLDGDLLVQIKEGEEPVFIWTPKPGTLDKIAAEEE